MPSAASAPEPRRAFARHRLSAFTLIEPLRLCSVRSAPPFPILPVTTRLSLEAAGNPSTSTEPDPVLASSEKPADDGIDSSIADDPVLIVQGCDGVPLTIT